MSASGIYALVGEYARAAGIEVARLGLHGLRATAATSAPEHEADIAKVQQSIGQANISTTRIYDVACTGQRILQPSGPDIDWNACAADHFT